MMPQIKYIPSGYILIAVVAYVVAMVIYSITVVILVLLQSLRTKLNLKYKNTFNKNETTKLYSINNSNTSPRYNSTK